MSSNGFAYRVAPGDSLAKIARAQLGAPIYGSNGTLRSLLTLNPSIKNADRIYPGQEIVVSVISTLERVPASEAEVVVAAVVPVTQPVVEPVVAKPAVEVQTTPPVKKSPGAIGVGADVHYVRLDGRDNPNGGSTATFLSELSPGVRAFWNQSFTDHVRGQLNVGWMQLNMQSMATRHFESDHISLANGSYELRYGVGSSGVFARAGLAQQVFIRAIDAQTLALERALIPDFGLGAELCLFDTASFSGSLRGAYDFLGSAKSANFDVSSGHEYAASLQLVQKFRASEIQGSFGYKAATQASPQLGTIDRTSLNFGLNYVWIFE